MDSLLMYSECILKFILCLIRYTDKKQFENPLHFLDKVTFREILKIKNTEYNNPVKDARPRIRTPTKNTQVYASNNLCRLVLYAHMSRL